MLLACVLYDTTLSGTELETIANSDLETCSRECKEDSTCKIWTFDFVSRVCHKKADDAGHKSSFAHNHISGNQYCQATAHSHCVEADTAYGGSLVIRQDTGDIIACQRACTDNPSCTHWEWDVTEDPFQKCFLKNIATADVNRVAKIGSLAAPKDCVPKHNHISKLVIVLLSKDL